MKKVKVYCGESVQHLCGGQMHPYQTVKRMESFLDFPQNEKETYSNDPDFVSAIKYITEKKGIETEFFLNGISCGNDIEPIFEDFNRAITLLNLLTE
jgi:hypothetical protein